MLAACNPQCLFFCLYSNLIVWHFGNSCKYDFCNKAEVHQTAVDLTCSGIIVCDKCYGYLSVNGCYPRHVLDDDGNRSDGWIAQGYCDTCNCYPSLIPDFIMPHKHYDAKVIERVIVESENGINIESLDGCSADVSTMRRWIKQFKQRGSQAVGWLLSILLKLFERHISLLELQNRSLLKQLTRLLNEFHIHKSDSVIGKVNIILTTQNCGFL